MNILLMGPRACGKTTIGQLLSVRLGMGFVDLDQRALAAFQEPTIREVWAAHGENAWRTAECTVLMDVLACDGQVIALGGGTPMIPAAKEAIERGRKAGSLRTVYLRCFSAVLIQRLLQSPGDRPSLTGAALIDEVNRDLAAREPIYLALADVVYDSQNASPDEVAEGLARRF